MDIKKIVEEWEIWDEKEEVAKSKEEAKRLVPEHFYKWIHIFGKKQSERMPTRKLWNHVIETKERFVPLLCIKKRKNVPIIERKEGRDM